MGIDFGVKDRVFVITGAAQGIGRAIALAAAERGAVVALCDRDEAALASTAAAIEDAGGVVSTAVLDVRELDAVAEWIATIGDDHGRVDVLVNNAGGGFAAAFTEVSAKGEAALIAENFTSVTACIRAVVPLMPAPSATTPSNQRGGGGSIINITSIEAHRAGPGFAVYSAMKAAVANLTKSLALELAPRHIRVNCVAPDVIPTPGIGALGDPDAFGDLPITTPLPYAGHVDDVAAAALYLASDASAYVTGTTIHIDGGNHAAGGWHRRDDGTYSTH